MSLEGGLAESVQGTVKTGLPIDVDMLSADFTT